MIKQKRMILFLICALLFLITTPLVIFYSQGYRMDFKNKTIVKTGGFYFKVVPTGAEIYINGELKEKTDAFFRAAFLENFLPGKYLIEIKKQGYLPWQKELTVEQNNVAEAKNIVLIPKMFKFETLLDEVKNIAFSPDEKTLIITQNIPAEITNTKNKEKQIWELKVYNLEKNIKSHLINEKEISKTGGLGAILASIDWMPETNSMILETEINSKKEYFALDLDKNPVFVKPLDALKDIKNFSAHPFDQNKIFFQKNSSEDSESLTLFEFSPENQTVNPVINNVIAYKISDEDIFWLSKAGILNKTDFEGNTQAITLLPFPVKEEVNTVRDENSNGLNYEIDVLNSYIFLKENDGLFVLNNDTEVFTKIADKINSFSISPDLKKLCFWNDSEIWLLFLKDDLGQPKQIKGEKILLVNSEKIGNVFWYNAHHLIFNAGDKIKIIEIDDRNKIQSWDIVEFVSPEIYFNQTDRKLYILTEGKLFVSEKL